MQTEQAPWIVPVQRKTPEKKPAPKPMSDYDAVRNFDGLEADLRVLDLNSIRDVTDAEMRSLDRLYGQLK